MRSLTVLFDWIRPGRCAGESPQDDLDGGDESVGLPRFCAAFTYLWAQGRKLRARQRR